MGTIIDIADMVKKLDNPPNRIRELRKAKRMTLAQLAVLTNTGSTSQLGRFETGERDLTFTWARKIARALGTDIGQLLRTEDNPSSLDDAERAVIEAIRQGQPLVAVARVAESFAGFRADNDDAPKRRA